jgi:tetratricopeptide (TPR) repeat protein
MWTAATRIHQHKDAFVATLRDFAIAAAGSYGDEGPQLLPLLDAAGRALTSWDQAIGVYETALRTTPPTSDLHATLGSVYLDRSRVQDALREFAEAAHLDGQRADVHELSGLAYEMLDDEPGAAHEFERAVALAPSDLAVAYNLARALLSTSEKEQARKIEQRLDSSMPRAAEAWSTDEPTIRFDRIGLFRQSAGIAPIFLPQIYVRGFRLLAAGRYVETLQALRSAASIDPLQLAAPNSPTALGGATLRSGHWQAALSRLRSGNTDGSDTQRLIGIAYWAGTDYDKSVTALEAAIAQSPVNERARIMLADVLVAADRPVDAEHSLEQTIRLMPDSGLAHYRLGAIYQSQSLVPKAIGELTQATACVPLTGLDNLFERIGALYTTQANFDEAITAYQKRINVNPNNPDAHRKLGEIYALQGQNDEALAEFAVTRWLDPRDADARAGSAQLYLRLGRYEDAFGAASAALGIDSRHQKARFARGTALARLGRPAEGQRDLDEFRIEMDRVNREQQQMLEVNRLRVENKRHLAAEEYDAALVGLRQLLERTPNDGQAQLQLGSVLVRVGRPEEAIAPLLKARDLADAPEIHRVIAAAYEALGRVQDRDRETVLFQQMSEKEIEERLKNRPPLR